MTGTMQSQYQGSGEAWEYTKRKLTEDGYTIVEKSSNEPNVRFFEIGDGDNRGRGLWVEINTKTESAMAGTLKIDMHWLTQTKDPAPDWMLQLAVKLEEYLTGAGSRCVFGEVRSDNCVKRRLRSKADPTRKP